MLELYFKHATYICDCTHPSPPPPPGQLHISHMGPLEQGQRCLTETAALIKMWLSAMEKAGLRVLCTLRGPSSPWLLFEGLQGAEVAADGW